VTTEMCHPLADACTTADLQTLEMVLSCSAVGIRLISLVPITVLKKQAVCSRPV